MNQQNWQRVEEIVDTALTLDRPQREDYIQDACGDDKKLKTRVTELLENIEEAEQTNYLGNPRRYAELQKDAAFSDSKLEGPSLVGEQIGTYRVQQVIGHGGMASVYLAERADDAYQGQVALKVMRRGMDTPSNIERFRRERTILAGLDHPNIARLLDGGVTKAGLPYLVMEYINGTPLLDYCNHHTLTVNQRLKLFRSVCKAVQYAHKNTVIHRDLKPSNILVTQEGRIKILDFGIAKLLEPEDPNTTLFQTQEGARLLTLSYAAPEQINSEPVTTATDSYSLGILLYELLAGVHPFDFEDKQLTEIETLIRQKLPIGPSNQFKSLPSEEKHTIAEERDTDPSTLSARLQGDLDAIIMKALRKEPEARYDSTGELLDDLMRHEQNRPLVARDDSWRYKSSKFLKRYKTGLAVAAGFLLLIIGFTVFYTWQITEQKNRAQLEAQEAQQISNFLLGLYDTASEEQTVSVEQLLQKGLQEANQLQNEPVFPSVLSVMGQAYLNFGDYDKALDLYQKALKESRVFHGENSSEHASILHKIGNLHRKDYNHKKALPYLRESYKIRSEILGTTHVETAHSLSSLAEALHHIGKLDSAELYARKALEIQQQLLPPAHRDLLDSMVDLANLLREQEQYAEAEELLFTAISRAENEWANNSAPHGAYYNDLAYLYRHQEQYKQAIKYYNKALEVHEEEYPRGHPEVLMTRRNLATSQYFAGQYNEAEKSFQENVSAVKEKYSTNHPRTAAQLNMLGLLLLSAQRHTQAEPYLRESVSIHRNIYNRDDLRTAYTEGLLAASLNLQSKNKVEADSLFRHHYRIFKANADEFKGSAPNNLTRLIEVYEENSAGDSLITAYQQLLD